MHGLFRVRGFTQDDAHIYCLPEQLEDEIVGVLDLIEQKQKDHFILEDHPNLIEITKKDFMGFRESGSSEIRWFPCYSKQAHKKFAYYVSGHGARPLTLAPRTLAVLSPYKE